MNNNSGYAAIGNESQGKSHDPYAKKPDPYAKKPDPYAKKPDQEEEKKAFWALDFEIARFFRENYNAGVDFEESPRDFFDAQYIFGLKMKLLSRNITTMITKLIVMLLFSISALFLPVKLVLIAGFFYTVSFLVFIAVPIAFVKYTRQYIVDDTENGKLKRLHDTYSSWFSPLEVIAMNTYTIMFIIIQFLIFINSSAVIELIQTYVQSHMHFKGIISYVSSITATDIRNSAFIVLGFYIASYFLYWAFIYKHWSPKWEAVRRGNERAYRRTNQKTATNLMDAITKKEV